MFSRNDYLIRLWLDWNNLDKLPEKIFQNNKKLELFNFLHNKFRYLKSIPNLYLLNLTDNHLTNLSLQDH